MSSLFDDTEDDLSLRTRREAEPEYAPAHVSGLRDSSADREVTLNTGTVLALFFALALVCAVFFGFGYSLGRKSAQPAIAAADASTPSSDAGAAAEPAATPGYKPAPGSPAIQPIPGYMSQSEANQANEKAGAQSAAATPAKTASAHTEAVTPVQPPATFKPAPIVRTPAPAAAPTPSYSSAAAEAPGTTYVQIAAVSHQEDADVLISALKRRGYKVLQRTEETDKLIHVQIGPFGNRKDAEVTRQKLLSDGYNAFLK